LPPLIALYFSYILYFVFFHQSEYADLIFIKHPFTYKIVSDHLQGFAFTLLEASLLANIILCYRAGVRSNSIYQRDRSVVIGIGGDSGAGKSTLLQDIKSLLNNNIVEVEGDADHKWERGDEQWDKHTHLDPKANFLHRQADTILELKHGKEVRRGDYDHATGQFTPPKLLQPKDFIVISGLHTFYLPKMRKIIDLKIFMDPDKRIQSYWKISRDTYERGHQPEQVISQMRRRSTDVDKFVAPQKDFADIIVRYFSPDDYDPQIMQAPSDLYLNISLSSSLQLENLVQALNAAEVLIRWDYSQNLSKQEILLSKPLPIDKLANLATELIPNLDELVSQPIGWKEGYRGFVQLIVLMSLSDLKREQEVPGVV
jgi:uridine kinase